MKKEKKGKERRKRERRRIERRKERKERFTGNERRLEIMRRKGIRREGQKNTNKLSGKLEYLDVDSEEIENL